MVLLLVTHYVEVPSSRVPLCCIILNDVVKRKSLPPNLKCRMVIPSCGNYSSSVWDASSIEELQQWIDNNLMDGVAHIAEIPEEFTFGLSLELTTSRAADKVATSSKNTIEKINTTGARVMETMAEKLDRLDQRTNLITATREATSAAVGKVRQATDRALESEGVQKSLATITSSLQNAGWVAGTRVNKAFNWVGARVKESFPVAPGAGAASGGSYSAFGAEGDGAAPPSYNMAYSAPAYMPVSTHAARGSTEPEAELAGGAAWGAAAGAAAEEAAPAPQFTLHDEGCPTPTRSSVGGGGLGAGGAEGGAEHLPLMTGPQGSADAQPLPSSTSAH